MTHERSIKSWFIALLFIASGAQELHHTVSFLLGKTYDTKWDWMSAMLFCAGMIFLALEMRTRMPHLVNRRAVTFAVTVSLLATVGTAVVLALNFLADEVTIFFVLRFVLIGVPAVIAVSCALAALKPLAAPPNSPAYVRDREPSPLEKHQARLYGLRVGTKIP